jgi:hypothetical protein
MSIQDAIMAVSEGNPGAASVCCQALTHGKVIDPDSAFGGFGLILFFDSCGIYGSRIWMLYKDVCKGHLGTVFAIDRGYQLGQLAGAGTAAINHAIDNYGEGLDLTAIVAAVQAELPNFNLEGKAT